MHFDVKLVTTFEQLDALREGWQALSARVAENTGFHATWDYTRVYLTFHQPAQWVVVVLFAPGQPDVPVAVFPLLQFNIRSGERVFRAFKSMGVAYVSYIEFAVQSPHRKAALQTVRQLLQRHFACDVWLMGPFAEDSALYVAALEALPSAQMVVLQGRALCQIDTRGQDFAAYFSGRKYATLPDARRCERLLHRAGALDVAWHTQGPELEQVMERLCCWSENKFNSTHLYRHRADWKAFFVRVVQQLAPSGWVELGAVRLDGRLLAAGLFFVYKGRRYYYLAAYDPDFAKYSPAKVLMAHAIERTFDQRGVFCFGGGLYAYKLDWCQTVGEVKFPVLFLNPQAQQALEPVLSFKKIGQFFVRD